MNYFIVNKQQLHDLLRAIGLLGIGEQLLAVNNIDLFDSQKDHIGVVISKAGEKLSGKEDISMLTEKELTELHKYLLALQFIIVQEQKIAGKRLLDVQAEMERRSLSNEVDEDGIPKDIDEKISAQLRDILSK